MIEIEFFRPLNFLNKTTTQTIMVLIRMVTPPTSGTIITRIVLVSVLSTKSVAIGGDVLEFEGVELVVGGVDVVVGGIILLDLAPRVPGTVALNLAAVGTNPILKWQLALINYSFLTM